MLIWYADDTSRQIGSFAVIMSVYYEIITKNGVNILILTYNITELLFGITIDLLQLPKN